VYGQKRERWILFLRPALFAEKNKQRFTQGSLKLGVISKRLNVSYKLYYIIRGDEALTPPSFGGQFRLTVKEAILKSYPLKPTHKSFLLPQTWFLEQGGNISNAYITPKKEQEEEKENKKTSLETYLSYPNHRDIFNEKEAHYGGPVPESTAKELLPLARMYEYILQKIV